MLIQTNCITWFIIFLKPAAAQPAVSPQLPQPVSGVTSPQQAQQLQHSNAAGNTWSAVAVGKYYNKNYISNSACSNAYAILLIILFFHCMLVTHYLLLTNKRFRIYTIYQYFVFIIFSINYFLYFSILYFF